MKSYSNKKYIFLCIFLFVVLIISVFLSFGIGRYSQLRYTDIVRLLISSDSLKSDKSVFVLLKLRTPRILVSIMVGGALGISGAVYQALFANPIVSPDNLGVSHGASFGAVISLVLGLSAGMMKGVAFAMGCLAVGLVFCISNRISKGRNMTMYLILIGMVVSSVFSALLSIMKYVADPENQLPQITYWLLGSFSKVTSEDMFPVFAIFVIGIIPILLLRWRLNLLQLSDEEALAMGVRKKLIQIIVVICATLLTSVSTSVTGGINWIGLIIPHIARLLVGNDYRKVTIISLLLGSIFLVLLDDVARSITTSELPISILTSLIGAPIFLVLLFRDSKGGILNER